MRSKPKRFLTFGFLAGGLVASFAAGAMWTRWGNDSERTSFAQNAVRDAEAAPVDFSLFWDVWDFVKAGYVTQPVLDRDLFYGSLEGLVASLDDPYSVFFDPETAQEFGEELNGSFEGIGAEIGVKDGQLQIIAPLPDTPAEHAGLLPADQIFFIDGADTTVMAVDEAVARIRGEKGTEVTLTVWRPGTEALQDFVVVRDTITIESVRWNMRDDGVALIEIFFFHEDTPGLFSEAVADVLTSGASGVIVDLRNNPGGYLDAAVKVASAWVDRDVIVIEASNDAQNPLTSFGAARLAGIPTVVLVNGGSASAAEILAGALQDHKVATVVGESTFGKGSVQDYREFTDGSALKITVAHWLTPLGRSIDEEGIAPDVVVEWTPEDFADGRDPFLEKALEILYDSP